MCLGNISIGNNVAELAIDYSNPLVPTVMVYALGKFCISLEL